MNKEQIRLQLNNLSRFFAWRTPICSVYEPKFFGKDPCACITSSKWKSGDSFTVCEEHQKEFDIKLDLFQWLSVGYISNMLLSEEGIIALVDIVWRCQRVHLKDGLSINQLNELAREHFAGIPFEDLRIFAGATSIHHGYGYGNTNTWFYMTGGCRTCLPLKDMSSPA